VLLSNLGEDEGAFRKDIIIKGCKAIAKGPKMSLSTLHNVI